MPPKPSSTTSSARSSIAQDGEVEALQALRHVDADLRLALAKVLGNVFLWFRATRDADRTFNGDALGIAERARREIPEAIEGVHASSLLVDRAHRNWCSASTTSASFFLPIPGSCRSSVRVRAATAPIVGKPA